MTAAAVIIFVLVIFFLISRSISDDLQEDAPARLDPWQMEIPDKREQHAADMAAAADAEDDEDDQKVEIETEETFNWKCLCELAAIRDTATTDDLIGLSVTDLTEYIEWRKHNRGCKPRAFFYRPGAPDIQQIKASLQNECIQAMINKQLR